MPHEKEGVCLLITGGSGYVSSVLLKQYFRDKTDQQPHGIVQRVSKIVLTDVNTPRWSFEDCTVPVIFHKADLTNYTEVSEAFAGVDVVLHMASYGMSGREQLHADIIWKVNLEGTHNVIKACLANDVKSLIFTSTVNVIFGGQKIENGDETMPYFNHVDRPWDNYGNSKTQAEKAILQANGLLTADGKTTFRTCALRLPGIYGPEEQRHIPRVVGLMRQGLFKVTYGSNPVVEFIHSHNVTKAIVLAADKLLQPQSKTAGQAYFISDGAPINNFEFFRPLTDALNIPFPRIALPRWLILFVAHVIEIVYGLIHKFYDFQPLLCRAEVYKTAQTHYFSIDKAREELDYRPDYQNDMTEIAAHYKTLYHVDNTESGGHSQVYNFIVNIFLVLVAICMIMSCLPTVG